jgi:acetyl-CoA acetyltransferase
MSSETGVIIAGAAETDQLGKLPDHSTLGLHIEGALNAVADAGLTLRDIDGIATVSAPGPVQVAHALGIMPDWIDGTGVGGTSFLLHVRHAVAAIRAGYAKTILITHGESGRSRVGAARPPMAASLPLGQFEAPYGTFGPTTTFTIPALRYMKDYGLTHEQLAYVAVAQRQWAAKNPRAGFRDPITVEDVLASRLVAYPFHLLECCLVTDGGGALVVTSADRAAGCPKPPVHILGTELVQLLDHRVGRVPVHGAVRGPQRPLGPGVRHLLDAHGDVHAAPPLLAAGTRRSGRRLLRRRDWRLPAAHLKIILEPSSSINQTRRVRGKGL